MVFFLAGSVLCGLAGSMTMLVASRALQGLGGGALMVTAMAVIGRGHPVAGTRPLSRRTRRRVRRHHSHRPAARRILHRSPHLALGLLDQHSGGDRGVPRRCRRHPDAGPQQPSRHRLRRNRFRRARRIRTHAGHQLGRQYRTPVVTGDHRAVRGLGPRAGHLRVGGNPCGRSRFCRSGCSPARCSQCAASSGSSSGSRCWAR